MLLVILFLPLLAGLLIVCRKEHSRTSLLRLVIVMQVVQLGVVLAACLSDGRRTLTLLQTDALTISFQMDSMAELFCLAIVACWLLVLIYCGEYMAHEGREPRFYFFLFLTQTMLLGTALSDNLLTLYLFFEMTSLCSVPMILHCQSREALLGAFKYLYYSLGGAFLALFGIAVLFANTTTLAFTHGGTLLAQTNEPLVLFGTFAILIGLGAKTGLFPLHNWLPAAHPVAPAPASALLSGVITKAGLIGVLRVIYFIVGPAYLQGSWVQLTGICLVLLTVLMGSFMAYSEKDFKKRLAYSSISQLSYALSGLLIFTHDGLTGGFEQILFHAASKMSLFLIAGTIIYRTGIRHVDDFCGLGRRMPITFGCFAIVSLSMVGIPPFGGFWSKWHLACAALDTLPAPLSWLVPATLLVSALLTAGYLFTPIIHGFFPGQASAQEQTQRLPESLSMCLPLVLMAAFCTLPGLFHAPFHALIAQMMGAIM